MLGLYIALNIVFTTNSASGWIIHSIIVRIRPSTCSASQMLGAMRSPNISAMVIAFALIGGCGCANSSTSVGNSRFCSAASLVKLVSTRDEGQNSRSFVSAAAKQGATMLMEARLFETNTNASKNQAASDRLCLCFGLKNERNVVCIAS